MDCFVFMPRETYIIIQSKPISSFNVCFTFTTIIMYVFCSFIAVSYLYLANGYTTAIYLSADIAKVLYIDPIYGQLKYKKAHFILYMKHINGIIYSLMTLSINLPFPRELLAAEGRRRMGKICGPDPIREIMLGR